MAKFKTFVEILARFFSGYLDYWLLVSCCICFAFALDALFLKHVIIPHGKIFYFCLLLWNSLYLATHGLRIRKVLGFQWNSSWQFVLFSVVVSVLVVSSFAYKGFAIALWLVLFNGALALFRVFVRNIYGMLGFGEPKNIQWRVGEIMNYRHAMSAMFFVDSIARNAYCGNRSSIVLRYLFSVDGGFEYICNGVRNLSIIDREQFCEGIEHLIRDLNYKLFAINIGFRPETNLCWIESFLKNLVALDSVCRGMQTISASYGFLTPNPSFVFPLSLNGLPVIVYVNRALAVMVRRFS